MKFWGSRPKGSIWFWYLGTATGGPLKILFSLVFFGRRVSEASTVYFLCRWFGMKSEKPSSFCYSFCSRRVLRVVQPRARLKTPVRPSLLYGIHARGAPWLGVPPGTTSA